MFRTALLLLGLLVSANTYTLGVDLSAWDEGQDFNAMRNAGCTFILLRCTVRRSKDTYFEEYYAGATAAGIPVIGAYHYSYENSVEGAIADADFIVSNLGGKKIPIYYDMEEQSQADNGAAHVTAMMKAFVNRCRELGYEAHIYTNKNWYVNYMYPDELKAMGCKFWVAAYGLDDGTMNEYYKPNVGEYIWQYTGQGYIGGMGPYDMNALYGDIPTPTPAEFEEHLVKASYDINIRSEPSTDSSIVGLYNAGDIISAKGITDDGSWYIDADKHYFTTLYVIDLTGTVNCGELNVRDGPSTSSNVIDLITYGDFVYILKDAGDWLYVRYGSTRGYVSKNYISYN